MDNSDILRLFAKANEKCGYKEYAEILEDAAAVYEASEILNEKKGGDKNEMPKL